MYGYAGSFLSRFTGVYLVFQAFQAKVVRFCFCLVHIQMLLLMCGGVSLMFILGGWRAKFTMFHAKGRWRPEIHPKSNSATRWFSLRMIWGVWGPRFRTSWQSSVRPKTLPRCLERWSRKRHDVSPQSTCWRCLTKPRKCKKDTAFTRVFFRKLRMNFCPLPCDLSQELSRNCPERNSFRRASRCPVHGALLWNEVGWDRWQ